MSNSRILSTTQSSNSTPNSLIRLIFPKKETVVPTFRILTSSGSQKAENFSNPSVALKAGKRRYSLFYLPSEPTFHSTDFRKGLCLHIVVDFHIPSDQLFWRYIQDTLGRRWRGGVDSEMRQQNCDRRTCDCRNYRHSQMLLSRCPFILSSIHQSTPSSHRSPLPVPSYLVTPSLQRPHVS